MAKSPIFKKLQVLIKNAQIAKKLNLTPEQVQEKLEESAAKKSRRDFIKKGAAMGGALVAGSNFLPYASEASAQSTDTVAILGAGAAGLAAAYNLKKAGIPFHIYDAQTRIGGRMWTQKNFNKDGQSVEIGGELVDSEHYIIQALVKVLLAEDEGLEAFAESDKGFQGDIFHSNGRTYSHAEFIAALDPFLEIMNAAIEDLWVGADEEDYLVYQNADKIVNMRKYDKLTIKEFLYSKQMLRNVDRWVLDFVNVAYLGEYGRETEEQPSINLLYLIGTEGGKNFELFGVSDEAYRIKGNTDSPGSQHLTDVLSKSLLAKNQPQDAIFKLNHRLAGIRRAGSKYFLRFKDQGELKTGYSKVICTIPFSVLRSVEGVRGLGLSYHKQLALFGNKEVQAFGMGQNSKLFMSFTDKVWRTNTSTIKKNIGSFYGANDFKSQCFWESSRLQTGKMGILTNFMGGKMGLKATDAHLGLALTDLERLYSNIGNKFVPRTSNLNPRIPNSKQIVNWNKNNTTLGSYGCTLVGQWSTMVGALGTTELKKTLFFAGEHTSLDWQGYMEGGFESGMRAANELIASNTGKPVRDHYAWAYKILGIE